MPFTSLKPGAFVGYAENATIALMKGDLGADSRGALQGYPTPDKVAWTRNYLLGLADQLPEPKRSEYRKRIDEVPPGPGGLS